MQTNLYVDYKQRNLFCMSKHNNYAHIVLTTHLVDEIYRFNYSFAYPSFEKVSVYAA